MELSVVQWLSEMMDSSAGYFVDADGYLAAHQNKGWEISLQFIEDTLGTLQLDQIAKMDEDVVVDVIGLCYANVDSDVISNVMIFNEWEADFLTRESIREEQPDLPVMTRLEWATRQAMDLAVSLHENLFIHYNSSVHRDELAIQVAAIIQSTLTSVEKGSKLVQEGWVVESLSFLSGFQEDYPELWVDMPWQGDKFRAYRVEPD